MYGSQEMEEKLSTHAPAQGATGCDCVLRLVIRTFNPRSRTGSDLISSIIFRLISGLSTHAPAQGATIKSTWMEVSAYLSTHAPAQGATATMVAPPAQGGAFNPRSRTGSDSQPGRAVCRLKSFNPRSRTGSDCANRVRGAISLPFNPRSRTGSDLHFLLLTMTPLIFQPTLPHRERQTFAST